MSKAAELAALIANVNKGSTLANKNLIINGGMTVAQRSTSEASKTTVDGYVCLDRWSIQTGSVGTFTHSQSSDVPTGYGFTKSLKIDCTTADASPDYGLVRQRFEGQNVQVLRKGTSSAVPVTLSFWVKSNLTGNFQVNLQDIDTTNMRHIGATYSISSANTWEKKEITFAGDTSGPLDNDNAASFNVEWWLAAGSTYNSGSVPTSWAVGTNANRAAGLNVSIGSSTDNEFYLTGVQLEIGEKATEFEHESYEATLRKCHRYFVKINDDFTGSNAYHAWSSIRWGSNQQFATVALPQPIRGQATVTITGTTGVTFKCDGSSDGKTAVVHLNTEKTGLVSFYGDSLSFDPANSKAGLMFINDDSSIQFDAEI